MTTTQGASAAPVDDEQLDAPLADDFPSVVPGARGRSRAGGRSRLIGGKGAVIGRRASGAIVTQFIVAGASLVLQVVAARAVGAKGLGTYALFLSVLTTVTAIQTGWVGDSLTVLDRFDDDVRGALIASQAFFALASAAVAFGTAMLLDLGGVRIALIFAAMTGLWVVEEAGRRVLMARLEFWQLVLNDSIYTVGLFVTVGAWYRLGHDVTLSALLIGMAVGAGSAIVAVLFQLPREEFRWAPLRATGLRQVVSFATWRSAQAAIRPLALLLMRVVIALVASRALLGRIEGARLLLAPAITFVIGAGSFLLPLYSDDQRRVGKTRSLPVRVAVILLLVVTLGYGLVAFALAHVVSGALTGGSFGVSRTSVLAWTIFAAGFAAGLPAAQAAVAQRLSREVFLIRLLDSGLGLVAVAVMVAIGRAGLAPAGLGIGMFLGAALLGRLAARAPASRPATAGLQP